MKRAMILIGVSLCWTGRVSPAEVGVVSPAEVLEPGLVYVFFDDAGFAAPGSHGLEKQIRSHGEVSEIRSHGVEAQIDLDIEGINGFSRLWIGRVRLPIDGEVTFTAEADEDCCATISVSDIDGGSFDPDGPGGIDTICITAIDGNPIGCHDQLTLCNVGERTLTLTITDLAGESDSCDATVTVADNTPPEITCSATGGVVNENCELPSSSRRQLRTTAA